MSDSIFKHNPHINDEIKTSKMNIVLFEPEIPANTGNIARTCAITGTALHLIEPLGFDISEKAVRRAGLDYWDMLDLHVYKNWEDFLEKNKHANIYLSTTKGSVNYTNVNYLPNDYLVFGKETAGLPQKIHDSYPDHRIKIPMGKDFRSLNLSNSVAIVLYEALRQNDFFDLE
jgi:tRNA (cytidine/uridine-2'-O-)-methyltransferase